jgi:uncharacterized membrane protein YjfL (UPF0719 family)
MVQVGKETKNTENGPVDTGYMIGVEISDPEEQQRVQTSISYIVEDKKNNTINPLIQYLPMNMLTNLKIVSKKRFRLLKSVMVANFKLQFENVAMSQNQIVINDVNSTLTSSMSENLTGTAIPLAEITSQQVQAVAQIPVTGNTSIGSDVIIDYRTKYFEVEEKNKELQDQIN